MEQQNNVSEVQKINEGENAENPIYIGKNNCPEGIESIRAKWEKLQNEYGDIGSGVVGAGFIFKYKGLYYRMPPQGIWQGSISWEASKDSIEFMLTESGCENVIYKWGALD